MRLVRLSGFLLVILFSAARTSAQIRTVPRELLDSIANPAEAEQSFLMKFGTKRIETGEIGEDETPVFDFSFVNMDDKPLEIRHITTSCGCVAAKCDERRIQPGDSGKIAVTYYPKGHPGRFERRIFVYTGLSETKPSAVLYLIAAVRQGNDRSYLFPHQLGKIRMKVREFTFRSDMKDIVCLDFLNAGDRPVTPGIADALLPDYIRAWCETTDVAPGAEGEICIAFDPDKFASGAAVRRQADGKPVRVPLILEGLGVPPRESSIMLNID